MGVILRRRRNFWESGEGCLVGVKVRRVSWGSFCAAGENFGNLERVVSWGSKSGESRGGHFAPQAKILGIWRGLSRGGQSQGESRGGHFAPQAKNFRKPKRTVSWGEVILGSGTKGLSHGGHFELSDLGTLTPTRLTPP